MPQSPFVSTDPNFGLTPQASGGLLTSGNIDLFAQPVVKNPRGGTSTVYSFSVNLDGREVLLPRVTPDGRLLSEDEAIKEYKKTGRHLGMFDTPQNATRYAQQLHQEYEAGKYTKRSGLSPFVSTDPDFGRERPPDFRVSVKASETFPNAAEEPSQLWEGIKAFGREVNPIIMLDALGRAIIPEAIGKRIGLEGTGPINTLQAMGQAQEQPYNRMREAYEKGDYGTAAVHALYWAIPLLGPKFSEAAEDLAQGRYGAGIGKSTGVGVATFGPPALAQARVSIPVRPALRNVNPAERAAVEFGMREGVPIDAGTATGNRFIAGVQRVADESLLGSRVGGQARQAQAEALAATGERLAARTSPAPVTAEQAGQAVREAVTARATAYDTAADVAYSRLRAFEAQQTQRIAQTGGVRGPATSTRPFTNVPLAVDIAPTKAAMKPIYDALKRESELVPLMGDKARALTALDRLMNAPDVAPLSIADSALGELKTVARVDAAFRRTTGQGVAAEAVKNLEQAVRATAKQGGPPVFKALMEGRAATVNKFKTIEVLDKLRTEPVQVFNQAIYAKDAGIAQFREIARLAPQELPKIGRAYLENLLTRATAEGGFSRAQGLLADWQKLGPETKQLLFRDSALIRDLDQFFLLAKRIGENPNPSGTALTLTKGTELGILFTDPATGIPLSLSGGALAKLLHSPRFVRALTRGFRVPVTNTRAAAATSAELLKLAREQGVLLPAAAATDPAAQRKQP